jgi:hypothetical protein
LELNIIKIPKDIIMIPPIWLKFVIKSFDDEIKTELIATPNTEKTIEKPKTKNIVFNTTLVLFIKSVPDLVDFVKSEIVVPEMYAKNAGTIGSIHGAKNELKPAIIARKMLTSIINS